MSEDEFLLKTAKIRAMGDGLTQDQLATLIDRLTYDLEMRRARRSSYGVGQSEEPDE